MRRDRRDGVHSQRPRGFLSIPCDENHGGSECEDEGEGTAVAGGETSRRPNVVLPGNVIRMLQRRLDSQVSHSRNRGLATGFVAVDSRAMREVLLGA